VRRTLLVRDPPPAVIELHRPSRVELSLVPVDTLDDPARREALAAADGVDLVQRRWTRFLRYATGVLALYLLARLLVGCAALDRAVPALGVAHDVARAGCTILAASDGSSADVLAATSKMQRSILEAEAERAKGRGVSAETVDGLVTTIAALSRVIEANALRVVAAGGNGQARIEPCPAASVAP
jgi:hypothetical protein